MPDTIDIAITIDGQTRQARLATNATATDLAGRLPVTVTMRDFNGVEKVGPLAEPLTMAGVPVGAQPGIDDIGYYDPSRGLVFYYGEVGYWPGIVRIGQMEADVTAWIRSQPDGFDATIDRR